MIYPEITNDIAKLDPEQYYDIYTDDTDALILPLVLKDEMVLITRVISRGLNSLQGLEFRKSVSFMSGFDTYITTQVL